ncbi:putative Heterokaryon incompatibility domain-containing protein [Seiridium cardinale]|uniref:Heterokaryon incompatibility domain-containing protein n=1 Tax=Seiridium cardinale TaxID=138064 RepID=A0ABR2X928_9PEZI
MSPKLLDARIPPGEDGIVSEVLNLMPGPLRKYFFQDLYPLLQRFRGSRPQRNEARFMRFVQRNADTLLSGWGAWVPICVAAENGHGTLAKSMLEKVTDTESVRDKQRPETRLFLAAREGNINLVNLLLKNGASIEAKGPGLQSPLSCAAKNGHVPVVQLLIDNGADMNSQDENGDTPLSIAAGYGHRAIVSLFSTQGAELPWENTASKRNTLWS